MAQVTYRGVKYDTNAKRSQQSNKVDLVYRGVKLEKELIAKQEEIKRKQREEYEQQQHAEQVIKQVKKEKEEKKEKEGKI